MRSLIVCALSIPILSMSCLSSAKPVEFWIAPQGDDGNPGTLSKPFASLERARDAIREMKAGEGLPKGGALVRLREGVYPLSKTFELSEEDSGTQDRPIVYSSAEGEEARLIGGRRIPESAFSVVTDDAILIRMDPAARGKALKADLMALGITGFSDPWPLTFRGYAGWPEIFFDGQPLQMARWPNEGFAQIAKVLDCGSKPRENEKPDRPGKFAYEGDRPQRWLQAEEVYLSGYWCYKWYSESIKVAQINPEEKSITLAAPHLYGIGGPTGGYYFALNLLEELDQPGEYSLDRSSGALYFWPPVAWQGQEVVISLLKMAMISCRGTSHVTFQRLRFEDSIGLAARISGGQGVLMKGCTISNLAADAIQIEGGQDNGVLSCDLFQLGGAGIALSGGDRASLTPCRNFAENNHIHDYARLFRTHRDAISLNGVGCRASHNFIHDAPHHAMDFAGNDHVVEFNEIARVCTETDDAGAIYTGRDWTVRGTVIRHNYFHDIGGGAGTGQGCGTMAIYLDDNACGTTAFGNVIAGTYRAILFGGGRDNVAENNILVDCQIPVHIDNRGLSWSGKGTENWVTLLSKLQAVPYQSEVWKTKYPQLATILEDGPEFPKRNVVVRNLIVCCGDMNVAQEAQDMGTVQDNWVTKEDPGFADAGGLDFSLRQESPAFKEIPGFQPIPFGEMGLQKDEYRTLLPE